MNNLSVNNLREELTKKIMDKAESVIENKARTLTALLKYEIAVANTEIAMNSDKHGYDFTFISEKYADNVTQSRMIKEDGQVSVTLTIPQHVFRDASESEVSFFKTYILSNALTKLRNGS